MNYLSVALTPIGGGQVMIEKLLHTDPDYAWTFLRIIAGLIIFPYGMQKLFGWFGGPGIDGTLEDLDSRRIPRGIAWLIIIGQSFGSFAILSGFLSRVAAGGLFVIFIGALIVHSRDGWMMNWYGRKSGEGIEYFIMLLSLLLLIILKGAGALSVDLWLMRKIAMQ
jgi:putative oxidoreductase